MGAATVVGPLAVEEYLSNPAYEHYEYIDGQAVELNVGTGQHSSIQAASGAIFRNHFRQHGGGRVFVELRCRLMVGGRTRFYQPDVAVMVGSDSYDFPFLDRAPELVIEIRSPDDSIAQLMRKAQHYMDNGSKIVWIVLPEERAVLVCRPGAPVQPAAGEESLDAEPLLAGFRPTVDELFL